MSLPEKEASPNSSGSVMRHLFDTPNIISGVKWGALVGVAYYAIGLVISLLSVAAASNGGNDATKNPLLILPACLALFTVVFALYVAGYLPAMERGQIAPGLWGALAMIIVANLLQRIFTVGAIAASTGQAGIQIVSLLIDVVLVLLIGWLGAFYGVKRNARTAATRQEQ